MHYNPGTKWRWVVTFTLPVGKETPVSTKWALGTMRENVMSFCCSLDSIQTANTTVHCEAQKTMKTTQCQKQDMTPPTFELHEQQSNSTACSSRVQNSYNYNTYRKTTCWSSNGKPVWTTWNRRITLTQFSCIELR